ncbi:Abi-alpha family protein [Paludicola sp. MB14-C6]|uniref:Abi-alpha family protein n=1 Tax=Paludihabitans sp. MB14-C6 TaxID=3070656 RepID=UPI0027DE88FB|nr:Abi-alpha family protein [Paludicola sp. MB14-C6]WMJ24332.1 Abi-alpha family protein [Paludicola sp. MB14-C6]
MSEDSKAIEETAKAIGKGIDVADKVGTFIAPLIKGSLEQGIGIFEDKLKYARWERQVRLMCRATEFMKKCGITEVINPIPLKFAVPLLQGASLEDDDELQDLWAKLLVNAISNKGIELRRVYIDILERLSPLEAKIIDKIYSIPFNENQHKFLVTYLLPDNMEVITEGKSETDYPRLSNKDIEMALIDLARIGCISPMRSIGGGEIYSFINLTHLGNNFHEACTL